MAIQVSSCRRAESPPKDEVSSSIEASGERRPEIDAARRAARLLGERLKKRLLSAMANGGAPAAVKACADDARAIAAKVSDETGARVGRSSLRLRNPSNAGPPWVQAWLARTGEREALGLAPVTTVSTSSATQVARYLQPIAVGGICVTCHGAADRLDPGVVEILSQRYPDDAARGYRVGDLRGVLWAEVALRE